MNDKSKVFDAFHLELLKKLKIAEEGLKILKVAVNDKQKDPGATAFVNKLLFEIALEN